MGRTEMRGGLTGKRPGRQAGSEQAGRKPATLQQGPGQAPTFNRGGALEQFPI